MNAEFETNNNPGTAPADVMPTGGAPGGDGSLSGELNATDTPDSVAAANAEIDSLINESTFEARHRESTREINRLNEANRLSNQQLREMADNYKLAKNDYEDVTGRLDKIQSAMQASQQAGEVLPTGERIEYERYERELLSSKARLENEMNQLAGKVQAHQQAEQHLSADFVQNVKNDTLEIAKKFAPLINGDQGTMYQILKNEIIPQIDAEQPQLVDRYRRGEISLETLCTPYVKRDLAFHKQIYGARAGGHVPSGDVPAERPRPKQSIQGFSGFLN